jgi:hypothetical protein
MSRLKMFIILDWIKDEKVNSPDDWRNPLIDNKGRLWIVHEPTRTVLTFLGKKGWCNGMVMPYFATREILEVLQL